MPPKFIFEMSNVCKSYGVKEVLRDISLSFFYGAKIGVIGENGSGKSTLLKIMAGLDKEFQGDTKLASKMKIRYVAQEPELDLEKTVRENLLTAIKEMGYLIDHPPDTGVVLVPNRLVELSQSQAAHHLVVFARSAYGAFHQCHIDLGHYAVSRTSRAVSR